MWAETLQYCDERVPSVLWHCWLGGRKRSIRPVKTEWWGVGVVVCSERGADCLHVVHLMPLHPKTPSSLASLNPDWFYVSGTSLPRLSWKRVWWACLSVSLCVCLSTCISHNYMSNLQQFLCMLPLSVARSSSGGFVMCYPLQNMCWRFYDDVIFALTMSRTEACRYRCCEWRHCVVVRWLTSLLRRVRIRHLWSRLPFCGCNLA